MRLAPIDAAVGQALDFSTSDDTPTTGYTNGGSSPFTPGGMILAAPIDGVDTGTNVPNWGLCELVYAYNSSTAIVPGTLVVLDKDYNIVVNPATSNTGRPVYVALTNFAAGTTTRQGGWILRSGICPVTFSVAATTGAVYRGTAGNATPTAAAGAQILNATTLIAAASAFTRTVTTLNGSKVLKMARTNGVFIGQTISGTGIPGATTVAAVDPSGQAVTLSAAATASGTVTGTFTPTGFGIVHLDRAFVQGQIT